MNEQADEDAVFAEIYELMVENLLPAGDYLEAFEKYDARMEGWVTGQLLKAINAGPARDWKLLAVSKEIPPGRQRPDLYVERGEKRLRIEIKFMVIGRRRTLSFYYSHSFGDDLQKMASASDPTCLLTLTFPILDEEEWKRIATSAFSEFSATLIAQKDMTYGRDRRARIAMWRKKG